MKKQIKALICILCVLAVIISLTQISGHYRSDPENIEVFETTNQYILERTDISGHRSGGGIAPEETMMAFKNCAENDDFSIDVFEFDLHITKDNVLVLLHDDTLDRTSDSEAVFNEKDVRPENKTYDELRTLNMGAKFENENGETPFADLSPEEVTDDLRIIRVEDVLDYLTAIGNFKYIIEIKNDGELGRKGVDILHSILEEKNLIDRVIFGTFHKEVSEYVDETYPDMTRSTSIAEVFEFWRAALTNDESYVPPCSVLQVPYCAPYKQLGLNIATAKVMNFAHKNNMAVQFWTINNAEDMEYLISIGADCIMTDYPDMLYKIENQ